MKKEQAENCALSIRDLSWHYRGSDRWALSHVTCDIQRGSFVGIIGASGSGKSSLCHALVGLIPHYFVGDMRGSVIVAGKDVAHSSIADLSNDIGLVFQDPFNQLSYTAQTVGEELAYGLANRGVPRQQMHRRVEEVARMVHVDELLERNPVELSGGQVQRVAFGSVFVTQPDILVLDECTSQLDPLGAQGIITLVHELNRQGVTIIMVDHDMHRMAHFADQLLVMKDGCLVAQGSPRDIFSRPELSTWGIDIPDFSRLSAQLRDHGCDVPLLIDEDETIAAVWKLLCEQHVSGEQHVSVGKQQSGEQHVSGEQQEGER